jgi:hypothetical protein
MAEQGLVDHDPLIVRALHIRLVGRAAHPGEEWTHD